MVCGTPGLVVWLSPYWRCILRQPAASQPSLFTSTHAGAAGRFDTARSSCVQWSQLIEDTFEPSFSCPGLSPCSSCASELLEIILW